MWRLCHGHPTTAHMVQCLDQFPQVRDRSESFYRRQLFIPFDTHFECGGHRYIKDEHLQRAEVHQYFAKHVMTIVEQYGMLSEPEATKRILNDYKEVNDPVREFLCEFEDAYARNLPPFSFLYEHFKAWMSKSGPLNDSATGCHLAVQQFHQHLVNLGLNKDRSS
ncbi:primase-like DNA-binding domain-containing protein [Demequina aurantiaca]|uniref:primase-like DNA-binding domain-containing protein n=1 Tax=Demequina aurantiaca TaxID=676200 RepID=UPI003D32554D